MGQNGSARSETKLDRAIRVGVWTWIVLAVVGPLVFIGRFWFGMGPDLPGIQAAYEKATRAAGACLPGPRGRNTRETDSATDGPPEQPSCAP